MKLSDLKFSILLAAFCRHNKSLIFWSEEKLREIMDSNFEHSSDPRLTIVPTNTEGSRQFHRAVGEMCRKGLLDHKYNAGCGRDTWKITKLGRETLKAILDPRRTVQEVAHAD